MKNTPNKGGGLILALRAGENGYQRWLISNPPRPEGEFQPQN